MPALDSLFKCASLWLSSTFFHTNILEAYAKIREPEKAETQTQGKTQEMPEFSVTVTPYEREGSNIKGLARIYFENSFIVSRFLIPNI